MVSSLYVAPEGCRYGSAMGVPDFSRITWVNDEECSIDEWRFRVPPIARGADPHHTGGPLEPTDAFWILKKRSMVDEYEKVFATRPGFVADRMLELGIWAGGSVALLALIARPDHLAAIDISDYGDPPLLERFIELHPEVTTHWCCSQDDGPMLRRLIDECDLAPLDIVIDDASHLYRLSRRSFELLFPRLRPGGLYVLEDWSWSYWPQNKGGDSVNATQVPLVRLVLDLLGVMGSQWGLIARMEVHQDFVIVERGDKPLDEPMVLDDLIRKRDRPSLQKRLAQVKGKAKREFAALRHRVTSTRA